MKPSLRPTRNLDVVPTLVLAFAMLPVFVYVTLALWLDRGPAAQPSFRQTLLAGGHR
jgi:hypothetical protein